MNVRVGARRRCAQAPRIVEGLIAAAPREALTWREADGAWNIVEVLCHVADGEITDWMPRVERILAGGGRFMPFDREGGFTRYRGWTAEALVGEFGQLRRANLEKLDDAAAVGAAPAAPRRAPGVRPGHARAAAGVLGDARHGARRADLAAADAIVRPPRRPVEEILQPAAGRCRVSETFAGIFRATAVAVRRQGPAARARADAGAGSAR